MDDNDLTRRLTYLAADIEDGAFVAPANSVRARGDRRRTGSTVALAGVATVAVVATAAALPALGGAAGPDFGVGAPSASEPGKYTRTAPPSGLPSGPPASGGPSAGPSGAPSPSRPASAGRTTFPPNLVMYHEGESGWQRSDDKSIAGTVNPCGTTADATRAGRTAARTLKGPGLPGEESHSPSLVTHQVFLYANAAAAQLVLTKLVSAAQQCGWGHEGTETEQRLFKHDPYQPEQYWLHQAHVIRYGNALLLASADTKGAGMTSTHSGQEIDAVVAPLCAVGIVCR